jgi:hypothetical protein
MKKLISIIMVTILLGGCSDALAKVSKSDSALISFDGGKVTKGDVYTTMKKNGLVNEVYTIALKTILDKEIGLTDEVKTSTDKKLAELKVEFGDKFDAALKDSGYVSETEFYNEALVPFTQTSMLVKKYLNDNFANIALSYYPRKARIIQTNTEADAKSAIAEVKSGGDYMTIAKKFSTTAYTGAEDIYYSGSSLPASVLTFIQTTSGPTLSATPILDTANSKYYVVQLTTADPAKFKDEIISKFAEQDTFNKLAVAYYYKSYGFKIYDKTLFDLFSSNYSDFMIQIKK